MPQQTEIEDEEHDPNEKRMKRLSNIERQNIIDSLLLVSKANGMGNFTTQRGYLNKMASEFNITTRTVSFLWSQARSQLKQGHAIDVRSRLAGNPGRKRINVDLNAISNIPLRKRTNIRSLAISLGYSKSTIHRCVQRGLFRSHSNAIKPLLTDNNKKQRVIFCYNQLEPSSIPSNPRFKTFYNVVHIDEKWFFMSKTSQRFYMGLEEEDPHRTCKSKRFITKVMFLGVVARPVFSLEGDVIWDGKLGIFPFTETVAAKRKSKNRDAGVLEIKPIVSVTKQVFKDMLIQKVIPAIKEKWPAIQGTNIIIQQDNARPHIPSYDLDFVEAATNDGFNITLANQPPNSPDLNILDLGFFRAIQSLKEQSAPTNVAELIQAVHDSYEKLSAHTLNKVWLSYQHCMQEVMKVGGGNNYKVPHMAKDRLAREGSLPTSLLLEEGVLEQALELINQQAGQLSEVAYEGENNLGDFILEDEEGFNVHG